MRYRDIPADAIPFIHTGFTDCAGVMIAGAGEPAPQLLRVAATARCDAGGARDRARRLAKRRPDVQTLMKRVSVKVDEREDPAAPGYAIYDEVTLETEGGARPLSARVTQVRGSPELPLSREELWTKFQGCVQVGTAGVAAKDLFDALMSLERLPLARNLPGLGTA